MLDESNTLNAETPEPQPEEKGNRTFLIVGGIFAVLILLTLVCMAVYFLVIAPKLANTQASQEQTAEAQRVEQAQAMTSTAEAALFTPTSLPTAAPTRTRTRTVEAATSTLVVVVATEVESPASATDTMAAVQTQLAGQMTETAVSASAGAALATATAETQAAVQTQLSEQMTQTMAATLSPQGVGGGGPLPTTGFFDEVGLPLLLVLTFALLAVIFITRRMRKTPNR
jgi:hypothetical protein